MNGKMHDILAVESAVTGNYNRDREETLKVLARPDMFRRTVTSKTFFSEDDQHLNTVDTNEITTTVEDRLQWYRTSVQDFIDLNLQKDKTNQTAMADLVVDGVVLAKEVPAVTLLMLENRLQDVRKVLVAVPTLESGYEWEHDKLSNLFKTKEPKVTFSTKKTMKPVVLAPATDKHPAQVKEVFEDVPVAKITVDTYSGMLTSAEKATLLARLDKLLKATKQARVTANDVKAVNDKMGEKIFDWLYSGVVE